MAPGQIDSSEKKLLTKIESSGRANKFGTNLEQYNNVQIISIGAACTC